MSGRKWETLGRSLVGLRGFKGFTQEQVAQKLGVHQTTIGRLEQGNAPRFEQLVALAELYGVSLDALVSGSWANVPAAMPACTTHAEETAA